MAKWKAADEKSRSLVSVRVFPNSLGTVLMCLWCVCVCVFSHTTPPPKKLKCAFTHLMVTQGKKISFSSLKWDSFFWLFFESESNWKAPRLWEKYKDVILFAARQHTCVSMHGFHLSASFQYEDAGGMRQLLQATCCRTYGSWIHHFSLRNLGKMLT